MWPRRRELPPCNHCVKKWAVHTMMSWAPPRVALVVLWMGLHQEKFPLLATTLQAAVGVCGRPKWWHYTAVIAVRYPELDNVQNDLICFGNYLLGEQATSGGFLPIFRMLLQPICMQPQTFSPLLIGSKARLSSALMRTVVLQSCTIETKWSPPLAHPIRGCGSVQERHILCRHDRSTSFSWHKQRSDFLVAVGAGV